jgi:hypothetical protein
LLKGVQREREIAAAFPLYSKAICTEEEVSKRNTSKRSTQVRLSIGRIGVVSIASGLL